MRQFRITSSQIMKRINYGPTNAKSAFRHSENKSDSKSEISTDEKVIWKSKTGKTKPAVENASHVDSSGKFIFWGIRNQITTAWIITISSSIRSKSGKSWWQTGTNHKIIVQWSTTAQCTTQRFHRPQSWISNDYKIGGQFTSDHTRFTSTTVTSQIR